jgi:hypothetical protein
MKEKVKPKGKKPDSKIIYLRLDHLFLVPFFSKHSRLELKGN